ncbi:glyoxylase-like metal-dependent hydrolase (beta-lactamase superfamily II) [Jatrophihabitans sp. GAS493]|uniref:MBL fold metallo-hydrolase n=1 Tax=Jatrophihabitans sp. GAS493 TaxID=1907575 RepID=UPI000BB80965|nr:MBL fold metallo-hydrolase [Jatrophihabitans sp. GAS493]SOD71268.1 glyoxylase-like metal-dependent hydrolase (beta-lactamase superfamily II) [Jatrophihabitans sp. GAS493]
MTGRVASPGEVLRPMARRSGYGRATPRLEEVAADVWAWLYPVQCRGEANAGIVVGADSALIVDTLWDEVQARTMLAAMQPMLGETARLTVVNTHADGDHWWGNAAMPEEATIVASAASLSEMRSEVSATTAECRRLPDRSFTGRMNLDVSGRHVEIIEVGPGHSAGDVVVHVGDRGVVFVGDLVSVGSTPVAWHGPISNVIAALDTVLGCDPVAIIPGHGPVARRSDVLAARDYWCWVASESQRLCSGGHDPVHAARLMSRSEQFERWRLWDQPERLVGNVLTAYRDLRQPPLSLGA